MGTWTNNDGLTIRFGPDEAVPTRVGAENNTDVTEAFELRFSQKDLPAAGGTEVLSHNLRLPAGAQVKNVTVHTVQTSATATGAGTLDIKLVGSDFTTVVATLATEGPAAAGAATTTAANTVLGADGYFAIGVNTEDFTSGEWVVKVEVLRA